jgi:hypothetical protein
MGKYSDDTNWDDIVPLPQDDGGPNPLAAIAYTDEYSEAMSYLRAIMAKNEMSERALSLTEDIIDMNAAHYTVWFVLPLTSPHQTSQRLTLPTTQALPLRNPQSPKRRPDPRTLLAKRNRPRPPKKLPNLAPSPISSRPFKLQQRRSRIYLSNV